MPSDDIYELIVHGIKCPPEHSHILTPMEFEELVLVFYSYDSTRSGSVEKEEFKIICNDLKMGYTSEKLDELMDGDFDIEVPGRVSFEELCRLAVMIRTSSDNKVHVLCEALATDKTTPFVELHRQAAARDLKIKFVALDIRETCDVGLPVHVTEVT